MIELEVAIDLIVPDNTAYTVLVALRQLGYTALERVERSEIFRLGVDASPQDVADIITKISHAEIIYNPNKHRLSYALVGAPSSSADFATQSEAVVVDRDDETSGLVKLLAGPFGLTQLKTLMRGIAWRLYEKAEPAPQARVEWACRELLANPYSQAFVVQCKPTRTSTALR